MKYMSKEEAKKLAIETCHILLDKKLEDLVLLELSDEAVCDYFIICTSSSYTQSQAAVGTLTRELKNKGVSPYANNENPSDSVWAILDYGFMAIHVFTAEGREYYELDELWSEAKRIDVE